MSALQKDKTQQAVKGFLGLDPQNSCVHIYFESFCSGNYFYKCMILKKKQNINNTLLFISPLLASGYKNLSKSSWWIGWEEISEIM